MGRLIDIILIVIVLFVGPAMWALNGQERLKRESCLIFATELADEICTRGALYDEVLEAFDSKLDLLENGMRYDLLYTYTVFIPEKEGDEYTGTTVSYLKTVERGRLENMLKRDGYVRLEKNGFIDLRIFSQKEELPVARVVKIVEGLQ